MYIQSVIDLRETKHSSVIEDQEAKQTQRALGFVSKVMHVWVFWTFKHLFEQSCIVI